MPIKQVQLPPVPYAHQTQVKVSMTNYSLLLGNTAKTVVWGNWHINPFQVFYTAMFLVTAYVEQVLWKAQRQHWVGPLFFAFPGPLALILSQTLFLKQLHIHISSPYRRRPLKELHWNPKMANTNVWKVIFSKTIQALPLYHHPLTHTLKICKCKIFTSLSTHVSEQEEKLRHVEVSIGIPHKWVILIKQKQIWDCIERKKKNWFAPDPGSSFWASIIYMLYQGSSANIKLYHPCQK